MTGFGSTGAKGLCLHMSCPVVRDSCFPQALARGHRREQAETSALHGARTRSLRVITRQKRNLHGFSTIADVPQNYL